ncbi:MAG: hypothetical protein CME88_12735 [Hirschia sp.]|nr:hypothetical protein [Hirschia sp.]MBF19234.1 hypothetical protein [Hirschia sp.]
MADGRLFSPSAARNREVIRDVWLKEGVTSGRVLEIGSGTGEHAMAIMKACPDLEWIASDLDPASRASVAAWAQYEGVEDRLVGPLALDASTPPGSWGVEPGLSALYCANMIHISPWVAGRGVIAGAGALLKPGGRLFFYGPFSRDGVHISQSNADFDVSLKSRDPSWGVRDLERDVVPVAGTAGLELKAVHQMPANNLVMVFEK